MQTERKTEPSKEVTVEEVKEWVKELKEQRQVPIFEWFVSMFSVSMAILLFTFPDMLQYNGNNVTNLYDIMLSIMSQPYWAFTFLVASMAKSIGLLLKNDVLRIVGLSFSVVIYIVMTVCYTINFPTIGSVTFAWMALFSVISIFMVKHTG